MDRKSVMIASVMCGLWLWGGYQLFVENYIDKNQTGLQRFPWSTKEQLLTRWKNDSISGLWMREDNIQAALQWNNQLPRFIKHWEYERDYQGYAHRALQAIFILKPIAYWREAQKEYDSKSPRERWREMILNGRHSWNDLSLVLIRDQ
jgi:hypothetical protein